MRHLLESSRTGSIWRRLFVFATAALILFYGGSARADAEAAQGRQEIVILAFGDSLMAGYQIPIGKAFPAQLEAALKAKGYPVRVINSGVSGDTAADALARLDWSLNEKIDGAIVELGANDALRGLDPKATEPSLDEILKALKARGVELLVAGFEAPRNWGKDYDDAFRAMYPRLAEKYGALLYPFFLKDVATVRTLNLPDGMHPTPEGVAAVVRNILPEVEKLIARIREKRATSPS
ncbi:MAG: arylesterase [Rhodomicrobium sp.]